MHFSTRAEFSRRRSNGMNIRTFSLEGHPRSSEVTRFDRVSYILLVTDNNYGHVLYQFRDVGDIGGEIHFCSYLLTYLLT